MLYLQYMLLIKLGCSNVKSIINVLFRYYRFIEHNWPKKNQTQLPNVETLTRRVRIGLPGAISPMLNSKSFREVQQYSFLVPVIFQSNAGLGNRIQC